MTAAECLSQLTDIRRRIEALNETIAKCYSSASKSTPSYGGEVGGGTSDNRIERNVEKAIEHERQLQKLTEQFDQFAYDMTLEINRISNNIYAALLIQKYVNGNSWEMVAQKLGHNVDYTKRELHSRALAEFERVVMANPRKPLELPHPNVV